MHPSIHPCSNSASDKGKNSPGSNQILPRPLPPVTELLIPTFPGTEPEGQPHIGNALVSVFVVLASFLLDTFYKH